MTADLKRCYSWINLPMKLSRKQVFILIGLLVILVSIPLTLILVKRIQELREKAAVVPVATLELSSERTTYNLNESFDVDIELDTKEEDTSGTSVFLTYDKDKLEVEEVIEGKDIPQTPAMYPNYLLNQVDQNTGRISLAGGVAVSSPSPYNGKGIFGKIRFKAIAEGQAEIKFDFTPNTLDDCDVIAFGEDAGQDILESVRDLTITIGEVVPTPTPTVTPTVTPTPTPTITPTPTPTPSPTPTPTVTPTPTATPTPVPLSITKVEPNFALNHHISPVSVHGTGFSEGLTVKIGEITATITNVTSKVINAKVPKGIAVGTYDIIVTNPNGQSATLTAAFTVTVPGDVDHDKKVDDLDFSRLLSKWGQTEDISDVDFSEDGKVDDWDFSLMLSNWTR